MAKTKTFKCICGHLAYYIPRRRGWFCFCGNPSRTINRGG